jgi:hypothetical protein
MDGLRREVAVSQPGLYGRGSRDFVFRARDSRSFLAAGSWAEPVAIGRQHSTACYAEFSLICEGRVECLRPHVWRTSEYVGQLTETYAGRCDIRAPAGQLVPGRTWFHGLRMKRGQHVRRCC